MAINNIPQKVLKKTTNKCLVSRNTFTKSCGLSENSVCVFGFHSDFASFPSLFITSIKVNNSYEYL